MERIGNRRRWNKNEIVNNGNSQKKKKRGFYQKIIVGIK